MANGVDFSRLRRQNLFPEIPDLSGGTMGNIDFGGEPSSYDMGGINLPPMEEPFGGNYRVENDPRSYVNPAIAQPVGGPGSKGQMTAEELEEIINRIYTPETTSRDRFNRLLDAAPEREEPGFGRKLVAAGMGFGQPAKDALGTMEGVMYAPHLRNMQDWTAKTTPFSQAAQQENTANINERTLAGNVATATVNQNRYDQQNAINEEKNRIAEYRAESERILRNAQAYMQNLGKGFKPITTGTKIVMYNESTGEIVDTGMTTDKMTEEAKITLQNLGRVQAAQASTQGQLAVQASRNAGALAVQTLRNARVTGNGGTRGLLPSQQKQELYNKAERWLFEHPEDKQWVTLDPTQDSFEVNDPGTSWLTGNPTGMPPDRYDAFIANLYGGVSQSPTTPSGMPTPPAAPPMPQGGGPTPPAQAQPQGQLTVPSRDDPRFQTPPGYDPHGRPPGTPQLGSAQTGFAQGTTAPTPQQIQAVNQLEQQIQQLEAQLNPPSFQPRGEYAPPGARPLPVPGQQPWIVEQASKIFEPSKGPIAPNVYSPQVMTPQGPASSPQGATEVNMGPQQIQAQIAQLKQQQQQILSTPPPPVEAAPPAPTGAQQQMTPELQQRAVQHLQKFGLPVTPANIAHAIRVGDVR